MRKITGVIVAAGCVALLAGAGSTALASSTLTLPPAACYTTGPPYKPHACSSEDLPLPPVYLATFPNQQGHTRVTFFTMFNRCADPQAPPGQAGAQWVGSIPISKTGKFSYHGGVRNQPGVKLDLTGQFISGAKVVVTYHLHHGTCGVLHATLKRVSD